MSEPGTNPPDDGGLELRGVRVAVGAFRLGPISLALACGDYLAIMGPGGCGKTTLLKTIAGILRPAAGEIHIGGRRVDHLPSCRRNVGYVPQHSLLFPHQTVAANVRFGLRYADGSSAQRQARFDRAVELTGVAGLLNRFPATLSGGEARRVALARALAIDPAILLLDEPLSMLDPDARHSLVETLCGIRRETGTVTLHVTHHAEEAQPVASVCATMLAGRIVTCALSGEILPGAEGSAGPATERVPRI
jgi:ABC-type Fe3+/spermidine/putrescine transport system ATPase subunit